MILFQNVRFIKNILACLISIILFFIAWPPNSFPIFIFFAFIPILWIVFNYDAKKYKFPSWNLFFLLFIIFLLINFLLTSWVMKAHWGGGVFASVFNSLLMTSVFILVFKLKQSIGEKHAFVAFPIFWLAFEYLHLNWQLTWPWLTLGNVFSEHTYLVQWYEYTGILGGSLWVLLVNVVLFAGLKRSSTNKYSVKQLIIGSILMIIPFGISYKIHLSLSDRMSDSISDSVDVVIVQPNYEPHFEKFSISQNLQLQSVERLLDSLWINQPDLIVLPETFIVDWIWESKIEDVPVIKRMKNWLISHSNTQILTGASTAKVIHDDELKSSIRKSQYGVSYEVYNSALLISSDEPVQIFHKSKLVPGAEMTPYALIFKKVLDKFPIKLAGTIGNFGINDSISNFKSNKGYFTSMICYESIFGAYVSKYVNKGSDWICIITNDGWWGDSYGHQQHHAYARLRAIENRRNIVRCANTGISSVINYKGEVEQFLPYNKKGIIEASIFRSYKTTFYSKYGDYIGRLASFLAIIYLLQSIISSFTHRK